MTKFHITLKDVLSSEETDFIENGLSNHAAQLKGHGATKGFSLLAHDAEENLIGGLIGYLYYGCASIVSLYVAPAWRHQGVGKALMHQMEAFACQENIAFIVLGTMEWEARPFYEKLGFSLEYVRNGFHNGGKMFIMRKDLLQEGQSLQ